MVDELSCGPSLILEIKANDAAHHVQKSFREFCGPADTKVAQEFCSIQKQVFIKSRLPDLCFKIERFSGYSTWYSTRKIWTRQSSKRDSLHRLRHRRRVRVQLYVQRTLIISEISSFVLPSLYIINKTLVSHIHINYPTLVHRNKANLENFEFRFALQ